VWTDASDRSIIVEIVEYQADVVNDLAAEYFWKDLVEVNEAAGDNSTLESTEFLVDSSLPSLPARPTTYTSMCIVSGSAVASSVCKLGLVGRQRISKFHESACNTVRIYMAILRIPSKGSEILIHMNVPLAVDAASSSSSLFPSDASSDELDSNGLVVMQQLLRTFQVHDWGLFCV
jgi:hypothetical protein